MNCHEPQNHWSNRPVRLVLCIIMMIFFDSSSISASSPDPTAAPSSTPPLLTFKDHGKLVKKINLTDLKKITGPKDIRVLELHESREITYRALKVATLFDAVYGKKWKDAEEILITCSDGYQPSIPRNQFEKADAYFAFEKPKEPGFILINQFQNNEKVYLGPFYLIWDNIKFPEVNAAGSANWSYQVVGIDLIEFSDRFSKMAPQKKSSDKIKSGFLSFRSECSTCHSIAGEGGQKGGDLVLPISIFQKHRKPWLKNWIDNPVQLRPTTTMPALRKEIVNRDEVIDNILAYLEAKGREFSSQKP